MSAKVTSLVWEHSRSKGSARLLLLAIADHAHDDGTSAYPSIETLSRKTGLSLRAIQDNLKVLVGLTEVKIEYQAGPHGVNLYQVKLTPAESAPPPQIRDANLHPEPKGTKSFSSSSLREEDRPTPRRDQQIALKHLQPIVELMHQGGSFDLTSLIRERWGPAWREAEELGVNPTAVGVQIAGFFFQYVTDEEPDFKRIGTLVKRFGKLSLFGLDEGVGHADDPYRYAFKRCQQVAADRAASNGARS